MKKSTGIDSISSNQAKPNVKYLRIVKGKEENVE